MNEILDPINNYLYTKEPDYSLMINGEWGSGKSHFIENVLRVKYKDEFNFIYCSAYGLKTTEDFVKQISVQKNPVLRTINNSKTLRIGTSLASSLLKFALPMIKVGTELSSDSEVQVNAGSTGQGNIDLSDFWSFTEKDVIIIDDLERSRLKTNEIFGFLSSSFLNPRACKVILVCSESELIKKDKNYIERKEKIVRHTINFQWNSEEIIPSIIDSSINDSNYKEFLIKECGPFLVHALEIIEGKNLRKFGFFLSTIDQLSKHVSISDFKQCYKSLLQSMFVFSMEYIDGNLNSTITYSDPIIDKFLRDILSTGPKEKHKYESLFDVYNKRFIHSEQIFNLIVRGYVEEGKVKENINQFELIDNPENDWTNVLDLISRFERLTKEDFQLYYKKAAEYLVQNKYTNYQLSELGITYVKLFHHGIISEFKNVQEIDSTLIGHFNDSTNVKEFNRNFHPEDTSPELYHSLPKLHKLISDYHNSLATERFHQISKNYFDNIKTKDIPIKTEALQNILNMCDERLVDIIVDIFINEYHLANKLNRAIDSIKLKESSDIKPLVEVETKLDDYYHGAQNSLGLYHYNRFKTNIENLKKKSVDNKRSYVKPQL